MGNAERLYEMGKNLPEPALAELLDFAEFLSQKRAAHDFAPTEGRALIDLQGGLEHSTCFSDDPRIIQERLRNEWP